MFLFLHTTPQKRHKLPNANQLTDHNTDNTDTIFVKLS